MCFMDILNIKPKQRLEVILDITKLKDKLK